jgi:hypothetical protein
MSQGSNFKKDVMEALFNAPTNLVNNKVIMWAASNLPDEGGMGDYSSNLNGDRGAYEHDNPSFWKAIGVKEQNLDATADKVRDAIIEFCQQGKGSKSMIFEHVEKTCGPEGMLFLAVRGFFNVMESLEEAMDKAATHHIKDQGDLEKLIKELEEIRKRLGGDDK